MRQNYKMILQYEGTRYDGWQKQGNTGTTIQEKLETVLERLTGEPVEVCGSGRTDAGVHAMGQTANFYLGRKWDAVQLKQEMNRYLPEDIAVISLEYAPERFHSRFHAKKKVYTYQIETGEKCNVFVRRLQYHLEQELDVEAMEKAAKLLCGTADYRSFCGNKNMKKSTVRTVEHINVIRDGSLVVLHVTGSGFLQHMVRIIAGTLMEVGLGKRPWDSMTAILEAKNRQAAGFTAPAKGLCLSGVLYEGDCGR